MENRQQQILSEIKLMMASIRSQLEMLDTKMAELQQAVDPEDFAAESVDLDIEAAEGPEIPVAEEITIQEIPLEEQPEEPLEIQPEEEDLPVDDMPEEPVAEDLPETAVEDDLPETAVEDDLPEAAVEDDSVFGVFGEPEPVTVAAKAKAAAKPTINDTMADDCAWRRDMPGASVKDIRSAISLNDRVIFINLLFEEDAQAFVNTLAQINTMETLDEVVDYITARFPAWDMNSELVYRFMMAVRRKVK